MACGAGYGLRCGLWLAVRAMVLFRFSLIAGGCGFAGHVAYGAAYFAAGFVPKRPKTEEKTC